MGGDDCDKAAYTSASIRGHRERIAIMVPRTKKNAPFYRCIEKRSLTMSREKSISRYRRTGSLTRTTENDGDYKRDSASRGKRIIALPVSLSAPLLARIPLGIRRYASSSIKQIQGVPGCCELSSINFEVNSLLAKTRPLTLSKSDLKL